MKICDTTLCGVACLNVSPRLLKSVPGGLFAVERLHGMVEITVLTYGYDPGWCFGPFGSDLVRNAFSIRISLQFRRSLSDAIMAVELMAQAFC